MLVLVFTRIKFIIITVHSIWYGNCNIYAYNLKNPNGILQKNENSNIINWRFLISLHFENNVSTEFVVFISPATKFTSLQINKHFIKTKDISSPGQV